MDEPFDAVYAAYGPASPLTTRGSPFLMAGAMEFPHRTYTIRRKVLKIFGASFHIFDPSGALLAFSSQKAFKLKEDVRVYADESKSRELLTIQARQIIDFSAAYDVMDAEERRKVGAARRKGWSSILRDAWELLDEGDRPVAKIAEDSAWMAIARRFLSNLIPQRFTVSAPDGRTQARFRVHFNPFVYRLTVTLEPDCRIDPRLVLAAAILIAVIEQRQH